MTETDVEVFGELGLTKNESKVYKTLLQQGTLGAGDISKFSGVSYSRIYDVLASLEQKGFVKLVPEKSKKFSPTDPDSLFEMIDKKEEHLREIRDQVKKMKEFYNAQQKDPVLLGYGKPAFYKLHNEMKKPERFAYSLKYTSEYKPEWERDSRENKKHGVESLSLVRYDKETKTNVDKWLKIKRKIKKFDNKGIAIALRDHEILISLIKSNVTLLIKDQNFCDIMRQFFRDSYKNAEEIK